MQLLLENENAEDTANVLLYDLVCSVVLLPVCKLDKVKRKSPFLSFPFSFSFSKKIKIDRIFDEAK